MESYLKNGNGQYSLTMGIIDLIRGAKRYIKAANFLFQDARVISALQEAAKRGVAVFIISNIKLEDYKEDSDYPVQVSNTTLPNLNMLREIGCHVHILRELHAKFVIADGQSGIIMSANFASNSISKNTETGVLVYNKELDDLEYVFEKLYLSSDITDIDRNDHRNIFSKKTRLVQLDFNNHFKSNARFTIASNKEGNNLRNCHVYSLLNEIIDIIVNAQKYLYIVTWHFKFLDQLPAIMEALKGAMKRGVKVTAYCNLYGQGSSSFNASRTEVKKLERMGCKVYGDDNNHSKCVLSETRGVVFSANIDGSTGLSSGFEVGCVLTNDQLIAATQHVRTLITNSNKNKAWR